jgi:alpha-ketoglutarate-dependent taurine dioxygenase
MAPPAADVDTQPAPASPTFNKAHTIPEIKRSVHGLTQSANHPTPLSYSGTLDTYESFDVTNIIGREFPKLQLTDILSDDDKIRDLAVLVSQRGVVFFRNQDISIDDQKVLGQKLGELTGKPETSKLHKHALSNSKRGIAVDENGKLDDEVSVISSDQARKLYQNRFFGAKRLASEGWHADITFERVPSDYAILKIIKTPEDAGGDTLWASGYEAFDRLSPTWQRFAEGLTATHYQVTFQQKSLAQSKILMIAAELQQSCSRA